MDEIKVRHRDKDRKRDHFRKDRAKGAGHHVHHEILFSTLTRLASRSAPAATSARRALTSITLCLSPQRCPAQFLD